VHTRQKTNRATAPVCQRVIDPLYFDFCASVLEL
jgi:hypothetical protein